MTGGLQFGNIQIGALFKLELLFQNLNVNRHTPS
jgi:hypothetical protein